MARSFDVPPPPLYNEPLNTFGDALALRLTRLNWSAVRDRTYEKVYCHSVSGTLKREKWYVNS